MSADEITAGLEAGPGLDALVAEHVMGWTRAPETNPPNRTWPLRGPRQWRKPGSPLAYALPALSADLFAMWLVIEQLRKEGWNADLRYTWDGYHAEFDNLSETHRAFVARGDDWTPADGGLPLAVCRAAMLIVDAREARAA